LAVDAEAIVVGAGPGGAAAAHQLAVKGRHVLLLDRASFPRDKSCGDGLTRSAIRQLASMGLLESLGDCVQQTMGLRLFMRGRGWRDFLYPRSADESAPGLVMPRVELDHRLCRAAVAAGAELWERAHVQRLLYEGTSVVGVEVRREGKSLHLHAPVVIAADGASSALARQAGLVDTPSDEFGVAIRGYYRGVASSLDLLEIYTPLTDATDRFLLPSYGWVFPVAPDTVNIGVGLFKREHEANVRTMMDQFVRQLMIKDSRFGELQPCGEWRGAPLRFDFAPERSSAPGLLLVGDAAGLISPFTGEGISYALESGSLAASVVDSALSRSSKSGPDTPLDLSAYPRQLRRRHAGYFEAGRRSARRYRLVWQVLRSTFQNDRPMFDIARRAVLFPEGVGGSYVATTMDDVSGLVEGSLVSLRSDLLSIGELLTESVRAEWPFLARLIAMEHNDPSIPLRPALFLLLPYYACVDWGQATAGRALAAAATIELGYFAQLAHWSVDEETRPRGLTRRNVPARDRRRAGSGGLVGPMANWGNMFALMVGDFHLSQAYRLSANSDQRITRALADALGVACAGRAEELRNAYNANVAEEDYLRVVARKTAVLFELPCRLGAVFGGADRQMQEAAAEYGRSLGIAFQLTEDALVASGEETQFGRVTATDLRQGVYSLPVLKAAATMSGERGGLRSLLERSRLNETQVRRAFKLVQTSGAIDSTRQLAREYATRAQRALAALPEGPPRRSLERLADYVVDRSALAAKPGTSYAGRGS
jgi:geranylgeranyl reductase family protein